MADFTLNWKGDEVKNLTMENAARIISEFALTVEGESKKELRKGHGVETGTLRRSIHTALPGYDWGGDDVEPSEGAPERGGSEATPTVDGGKLTIEVGSGLVYAMAVHQGHHSFEGYHYLTNGLNKAKGKLSSIIARHKVQG
jgi:hypothetical protein